MCIFRKKERILRESNEIKPIILANPELFDPRLDNEPNTFLLQWKRLALGYILLWTFEGTGSKPSGEIPTDLGMFLIQFSVTLWEFRIGPL